MLLFVKMQSSNFVLWSRLGVAIFVLLLGLGTGCSDTLVDPRRPPTDAGVPDTLTDSLWDFDSFNTCATNERLCTVEGPPCEPLDDAGLPPVGCGPQPQCIDVMSNNDRCGNCDTPCNTQRMQCEEGQCVCKKPDTTSCGSHTCIDLETDREHCGECFRTCGPGENCVSEDCVDAPGDESGSLNDDPSGPIVVNLSGSNPPPATRQIAINNYAWDDFFNNLCRSDATGPDVYFNVELHPPGNVSGTVYAGKLTVSVNRPGYMVAISESNATSEPDECAFTEPGGGNASAVLSAGCSSTLLPLPRVMVRKLYPTTEDVSPITVTLSASSPNICLP